MADDKEIDIVITASDETAAGIDSAKKRVGLFASAMKDAGRTALALHSIEGLFGGMGGAIGAVVGKVKSLMAAFTAFGPVGLGVSAVISGIMMALEAMQAKAEEAAQKAKALATEMRAGLLRLLGKADSALRLELDETAKAAAKTADAFDRAAAARERFTARRAERISIGDETRLADMRRDASEAVFKADDADKETTRASWALDIAREEARIKEQGAKRAKEAEDERLKTLKRRIQLEKDAVRTARSTRDHARSVVENARPVAMNDGLNGEDVDDNQAVRSAQAMAKAAEERLEAARARVAATEQDLQEARQDADNASMRRALDVQKAYDVAKDAERSLADAQKRRAAARQAEAEREASQRLAALMQEERERIAADRRVAQARRAQAQQNLALSQNDETNAQTILFAAQAQSRQAWGWYRNKDSMAAQLEEEKAEAEAQRQFDKDFDHLKRFHRDWREAKNLSVDDEAVRRVAIARENEAAAENTSRRPPPTPQGPQKPWRLSRRLSMKEVNDGMDFSR